ALSGLCGSAWNKCDAGSSDHQAHNKAHYGVLHQLTSPSAYKWGGTEDTARGAHANSSSLTLNSDEKTVKDDNSCMVSCSYLQPSAYLLLYQSATRVLKRAAEIQLSPIGAIFSALN